MLHAFEQLGLAWLRLAKDHIKLFFLEAKLAKASIVPLLVTIFCFIIVLIGTWLVVLTLGVYVTYELTKNIFLSIFIMLFINLIILSILIALIYKWYKQLTFQNTRARFKNFRGQITNAKSNITTRD